MKKSRFLLVFLILCLAAAALSCRNPGETPDEQPDKPAERPSGTPIYTLVRGDASSKEVTDAAVKLRRRLLDTYGIDLSLQTDWVNRGEAVEDHRFAHEILIGSTNRPESVEAQTVLNEGTSELVEYSVSASGEHYVLAAAEGCAEAAVDAFLAFLEEDLTRLNRSPEPILLSRKHRFPVSDIVIGGNSVSAFDAIVYPADYDIPAVNDVTALSELIYEACGVKLPVLKEGEGNPGRCIRLTNGSDSEVRAAGAFSYAMLPDENGITLDGKSRYAAACAMDVLCDLIREGMESGGEVNVSQPIRRLTDDCEKLILSAWTLAAPDMTTEEQFAELADCGFNQVMLIWPSDPDLRYRYLKWMTKYELHALWNDGSIRQSSSGIAQNGISAEYVSEDVTWGHMLRDEPSLSDFGMLAELYKTYSDSTGKVPYINLFPDYANEQQLGCSTYEEHLEAFFDTVKPAFSSVDIYPLNVGGIYDHYFGNLDSFSRACRTRGIPFGVYIQSVSFAASKRTPNEAELRWQAYCCLSFGATDIEYFTYRTPNSSTEDFRDALIGRDDGKTEAWYGAQKVNAELNELSGVFLRYENLGAFTVNPEPHSYMTFTEYGDFDALGEISVSGDCPVLIGAFTEAGSGSGRAFTCVNADDPAYAVLITVTAEITGQHDAIHLYRGGTEYELTPDGEGKISFVLAAGEGVFVTLD